MEELGADLEPEPVDDCGQVRLDTWVCKVRRATHFLQLGVLLLRVDEVEDEVECAREDEGQEESESRQIRVALRIELARREAVLRLRAARVDCAVLSGEL